MSLTTHEIAAPPVSPDISAEEYAHQRPQAELQHQCGLFVLMMDSEETPRRLGDGTGAVMYPNAEVYAEGALLPGSTVDGEPNEAGLHTLRFGHVEKADGNSGVTTLVVSPGMTVTGTWLALNRRRQVAGLGDLPPLGAAITIEALATAVRGQQVDGRKIGLVIGEARMSESGTEQKTLVDVRTGKVGRMLISREELVSRG